MSFNFPYPGPIPPYTNVAIQAQNYQPSRFVISAISLGPTTTVTTTANMNYVVGQLVRLLIPSGYGAIGLNEQLGYVTSLPAANQVTVNINSSGINSFVNAGLPTSAQIIAVGDILNGTTNAQGRSNTGTSIPGSFINISA